MDAKTAVIVLIVLPVLLAGFTGSAGGCSAPGGRRGSAAPLEDALEKLSARSAAIETLQCGILYIFRQPLFESQSTRRGRFFYKASGGKSKFRVEFETLQQDDEEAHSYREHYVFDGEDLVHINYQIKQVRRYKRAEPNEPVDAAGLGAGGLPLLGFAGSGYLKEHFEISLADAQEKQPEHIVHLHLKVRSGSVYEGDFAFVDIRANLELGLPEKVVAVSPQEDVYEVKLLDAKVDDELGDRVFEPRVPEGFGVTETEEG
jgi:outer membrane lipoprotein-sorting protein